jgi:hypothetical protein
MSDDKTEFRLKFEEALRLDRQGQFEEAIRLLEELKRARIERRAVVGMLGGILYHHLHDLDRGMPYLEESVRLSPCSEAASWTLRLALAERADEERGRFEEAVRLPPLPPGWPLPGPGHSAWSWCTEGEQEQPAEPRVACLLLIDVDRPLGVVGKSPAGESRDFLDRCDCMCHRSPGCIHIVACCEKCRYCGLGIRSSCMERHLIRVHPEKFAAAEGLLPPLPWRGLAELRAELEAHDSVRRRLDLTLLQLHRWGLTEEGVGSVGGPQSPERVSPVRGLADALRIAGWKIEDQVEDYRARRTPAYRPWLVLLTSGRPDGAADSVSEQGKAELRGVKDRTGLNVFPIVIGKDGDLRWVEKLVGGEPLWVKEADVPKVFRWLAEALRRLTSTDDVVGRVELPQPTWMFINSCHKTERKGR